MTTPTTTGVRSTGPDGRSPGTAGRGPALGGVRTTGALPTERGPPVVPGSSPLSGAVVGSTVAGPPSPSPASGLLRPTAPPPAVVPHADMAASAHTDARRRRARMSDLGELDRHGG